MLLMPLVDRFNGVSCLSSVRRRERGENSISAFRKGTQGAGEERSGRLSAITPRVTG
jgi:hypothetical protein